MGPIWGRQVPGGPHVGPMNLAIWVFHLSDKQPMGFLLSVWQCCNEPWLCCYPKSAIIIDWETDLLPIWCQPITYTWAALSVHIPINTRTLVTTCWHYTQNGNLTNSIRFFFTFNRRNTFRIHISIWKKPSSHLTVNFTCYPLNAP